MGVVHRQPRVISLHWWRFLALRHYKWFALCLCAWAMRKRAWDVYLVRICRTISAEEEPSRVWQQLMNEGSGIHSMWALLPLLLRYRHNNAMGERGCRAIHCGQPDTKCERELVRGELNCWWDVKLFIGLRCSADVCRGSAYWTN